MPYFRNYVGIDYSGAGTPDQGQAGIQVSMASQGERPGRIPAIPDRPGRKWSRRRLAEWCLNLLGGEESTIVAIDQAFSFPKSYLDRYSLADWDQFLSDFRMKWPTHQRSVEELRLGNDRVGLRNDEYRLTETWTSSAKSVFLFDVNGSVAKSTHAGLPWLLHLRESLRGRVHFWPFDGFRIPQGKSVVAEVYPSIFRRRYAREGRTGDQQDAFAICSWLKDRDSLGYLDRYFEPQLTDAERSLAGIEGWILGVA